MQYAHNMRMTYFQELSMSAFVEQSRKRPVNLTLNEALVAQAKVYTSNLSATMEALLADFVASQQFAQQARQQLADTCAADWNAVHTAVGSFADEHTTL
jgi:post-segregation antitoxin (ccd killing protein)